MILKDLFAPSFVYLSTDISTHPQLVLPIQVMGGWVSAYGYKYNALARLVMSHRYV